MTEQTPSGEIPAPAAAIPAPAAPAETAGAPSAPPAAAPTGAFGNGHGSGLARGKRPVHLAATAAPAKAGGYQPTALQVITPKSEYKNPFGSPAAPSPEPSGEVPHGRAVEESTAPAPAPAAPISPEAAAAPAEVPAAPVEAPAAPIEAPEAAAPSEPAPKAEIKILPPAEVKRAPLSWEKPSYREEREGRRDERPSYRPDYQRPREQPRQFVAPQPAKSGGFFGWLKNLFRGKKPDQGGSTGQAGGEFDRERHDHQHRRRHRGGRGRFRDGPGPEGRQGGFRPEGQQPQGGSSSRGYSPRPEGGENRGDDGQRRRRHRGGRGRFRDGPGPEGRQGGGAI